MENSYFKKINSLFLYGLIFLPLFYEFFSFIKIIPLNKLFWGWFIVGFFILVINIISGLQQDFKFTKFQLLSFLLGLCIICSSIINRDLNLFSPSDYHRLENPFIYILYLSIIFCAKPTKNKLLYCSIFVCTITVLINQEYIILYGGSIFRNSGLYPHFNHYGYYLSINSAINASLFIMERKRNVSIILFLALLINTIALSFNNTFGSWLGLLFGISVLNIFYCWRDRKVNKKALFTFLIVILCLFLGNIHEFSSNFGGFFSDVGKVIVQSDDVETAGTNRWKLWKTAFSLISKKPIWGYGIVGAGNEMMKYVWSERPANEFLGFALFFGVPALLIYLITVFGILIHNWRLKDKLSNERLVASIACVTYLGSAFFGNSVGYVAPLFYIMLGLSYSTY